MASIIRLVLAIALLTSISLNVKVAFAQDHDLYTTKIKQILSNKCYACHGPDANTREGGFRFDTRESSTADADSGERPIVPGDIESSELIRRIHATDDSRMPPLEQEQQLTDMERRLLGKWIAAGADWQEHWAFITPSRPKPPQLDGWADSVGTPIDRFVLKRLLEKNISPSPETDRATLIRRATLDLTGLPPTVEEVEAFLSDKSKDAYEKVVDRLLGSPHYGEHMASSWLDAARFADTNGYQNDFARSMWPWRDWVIKSFNQNMPFDQFTIEQIAGDMLPEATLEQRIATGFNRNNRTVTEGGAIEAEWLVENLVDRVETTSTVFLGLTTGCARCHDHKFDPISQREFYEFFAYFNGTKDKGFYQEKRGNFGPVVSVEEPKLQKQIDQAKNEFADAETSLKRLKDTLAFRQAKWESEFAKQTITKVEDYVAGLMTGGEAKPDGVKQRLESLADSINHESDLTIETPFEVELGQIKAVAVNAETIPHLGFGPNIPLHHDKSHTLSVWVKPGEFGTVFSRMDAANAYRGYDLILLDDGRVNLHLIHNWPGNGIKVTTKLPIQQNRWSHIAVTYDGSQKAAGLKIYANDVLREFETNSDSLSGTIETSHPFWIGRRSNAPSYSGRIADVRFFDRVLKSDERKALLAWPLQAMIAKPIEQRSVEESEFVTTRFQGEFSTEESAISMQLATSRSKIAELQKKLPTTMVMEEMETPRKTYLLNRGQYDQADKTNELTPGIPRFLPQPNGSHSKNRLGLARWLVDPTNPLTARVTVNRFWQRYFGVGLVETPGDFGVQSPLPSHPNLLDWLAVEFVESGWDVKAMQKLIVMSGTYRQSSHVTPAQLSLDSNNRWLGRGAKFRLPAESIRDNALVISGLLTERVGGPSMKPYQPAGVWKELAGGAGEKPYVQDKDDNLYRRSMYIYRKRTVPHPTMSTFDAGSRELCQVSRQRTNTPLQALALLNDATYVEASRGLAIAVMKAENDPREQVSYAFYRATARRPSDKELKILLAALDRYRKQFRSDETAATEYVSVGELKVPVGLKLPEVAAMSAVCSTILNLDETVTKE